jgi:hypothetical protein
VDTPKANQMDIPYFDQFDSDVLIQAVADPITFAEAFLILPTTQEPVHINYVEQKILASTHRKNVIRVHRRAGKSYSLSILALYHCITTRAYEVLIIGPQGSHVEQLFDKIRQFIYANTWIRDYCIDNDTKSPHHLIKFKNGSSIIGFTTGAKMKGKGDAVRGRGADLILIDEAQLLEENDWVAVKPIIKGDKYRRTPPVVYVAGTPAYTRGDYYDFCKHPEMSKDWNEVHVSIRDNPDQNEADIAEARALCKTEVEWSMEWLAEFPEVGSGVFPRTKVEACLIPFSYSDNLKFAQNHMAHKHGTRTIGVDWDKHNKDGHGPNIAVLEAMNGKFRVIYKEEIPQGNFSLKQATRRVIKLNEIFNPEWIYIDRGYGEFQLEEFQEYGIQFPNSGLLKKVGGISFAELVQCPMPKGGVTKKRFKQVMVSLLQKWVEEGLIEFCSSDMMLFDELINYRVISKTEQSLKFSAENDHAIDAIGLAAMAMHQRVENPYSPKGLNRAYVMPAPQAVPSSLLRENMGLTTRHKNAPSVRSWGDSSGRSGFSRGYLGNRPPTERSGF